MAQKNLTDISNIDRNILWGYELLAYRMQSPYVNGSAAPGLNWNQPKPIKYLRQTEDIFIQEFHLNGKIAPDNFVYLNNEALTFLFALKFRLGY